MKERDYEIIIDNRNKQLEALAARCARLEAALRAPVEHRDRLVSEEGLPRSVAADLALSALAASLAEEPPR